MNTTVDIISIICRYWYNIFIDIRVKGITFWGLIRRVIAFSGMRWLFFTFNWTNGITRLAELEQTLTAFNKIRKVITPQINQFSIAIIEKTDWISTGYEEHHTFFISYRNEEVIMELLSRNMIMISIDPTFKLLLSQYSLK